MNSKNIIKILHIYSFKTPTFPVAVMSGEGVADFASKMRNYVKHVFSPHKKTPLGRWNIHNHTETALKIKHATEDNCGISYHNYENITQPNNESEHDEYIYVMGYESTHN